MLRIACVGHRIYFEPHFCETSFPGTEVIAIDFDHFSKDFYRLIREFRPDVSIIYRPELHDREDLFSIPGLKIGFSTEPLPRIQDGRVLESNETSKRLAIIKKLDFEAFDATYHYDETSKPYCVDNGLPFSGYRNLPVNVDIFHPRKVFKRWDVLFVGKATPRRTSLMERLKAVNRSFLWVEHGVQARDFAWLVQRSHCVLNVHADDLVSLPPRVYIAAACCVPVISEPVGEQWFPFREFVEEIPLTAMSFGLLDDATQRILQRTRHLDKKWYKEQAMKLSVRGFVGEALSTLLTKY